MKWFTLVFTIVSAVSLVLAQPSGTPDALKPYIGKPVPDVTLVDVEGKKHKLSNFKGKVLLLNFWSPH
jgi:cytochrome oxidase Cu insertion factor (SCO1/SenC/PrrC family)